MLHGRRQCQYASCRRFLLNGYDKQVKPPLKYRRNPQHRFCSNRCRGLELRGGSGKNYIRIRVDGRRIYLHRYILEVKLGRRLKPDEIAHHVDENIYNNTPDNIELEINKAAHLARHNYYRGHKRRGGGDYDSTSEFGF